MAFAWLSLFLGCAREGVLPPLWKPHGSSLPKQEGTAGAHWLPPATTAAKETVYLCEMWSGASRAGQPSLESTHLGPSLSRRLFGPAGEDAPRFVVSLSLGCEVPLWLDQYIYPSSPCNPCFPLQFPSPQQQTLERVLWHMCRVACV